MRWGLFLAGAGVVLSLMLVLPLRWLDPPGSMLMLIRYAETRDGGRGGFRADHRWVDFARLGVHLPLAVIASEDQKFVFHQGFDFEAMSQALETRWQGGRLRGASTITQQVAKNLYLWPGKSWLRKGLEAWLTVVMEACWEKRRILEIYLNVAEFGDGIFGAEAASRHYFGRAAARLTAGQAARLAAVLPNPRRMRPQPPSAEVRRRAAWIRGQVQRMNPARVQRALAE